MSYCVNCGVELEKGCNMCPLCDTPVINPREKKAKNEKPVYPNAIEIPKSVSKRYWAFILSLVVLIPNVIMVLLNILIYDNEIVKYVVGAFVVAWIWFIFPLLWKKPIPVVILGIDALSLMTYLNVFKINGDENGWFAAVALPVIIILWAICNLFIFWLKKPRSKSVIAIAVLGAINIMTFVVEICMNMFYNNKLQITVSFGVTVCCVSLMIFFAFMAKSKRFKAWASRKFFM